MRASEHIARRPTIRAYEGLGWKSALTSAHCALFTVTERKSTHMRTTRDFSDLRVAAACAVSHADAHANNVLQASTDAEGDTWRTQYFTVID